MRSAPEGAQVKAGDRVAAFCALGGFAGTSAVAPEFFTFVLSPELDFAQGAGLILNYHTAYFALVLRGRLKEGDGAGARRGRRGGTASLQVARGVGARTIALVSSEAGGQSPNGRARIRRCCSATAGRTRCSSLSRGVVDIVLDPVGRDRFTDSLRSLREDGRLVVVGFAGGSIPEVKVNRLLLGNTEVVGAGWGAYVMGKPDLNREIGAAVGRMVDEGIVSPIVGGRFPLERAADALKSLDERRATGKVVLDVRTA